MSNLPDIPNALDLDAARAQRAAEREGKKADQPIVLGGQVIAVLPVELPIDVLAPLRNLDADLTLILRSAMDTARGQSSRTDATDVVIDILASNPGLPVAALDTFKAVAVNLLGREGFDALLANRPTASDYAHLVKGIFGFYGLSLGESLPSSDSSTEDGGPTSSGTSSTTSDSTPEVSGTTPASAPTWVPAGS